MFKLSKLFSFGHSMLYRISLLLLVWVLCGCGSQSAKLETYMRPELLYLKDQPYSRLYVEVDTIEGITVPDQWLDELKAFLSKYCSKPDGIEIVRDKPVPMPDVKGLPISMASILCTDGPRPDSSEQPAYLHVLFYKKDRRLRAEEKTSGVSSFCPCGIFCNEGEARAYALKHEVGHVLGLCKNPTHCDGAHCQNSGCLMYGRRNVFWSLGSLLGLQMGQLCADCQHDLELYKPEDAEPNLVFKGPFLIRREDGYFLASLPFCDLIIPSAVEDVLDWKDALSYIKDKIKEAHTIALNEGRKLGKQMWYIRGLYSPTNKDASPESVTDELAVLTRAADDPCPFVKSYAIDELKKLKEKDKK